MTQKMLHSFRDALQAVVASCFSLIFSLLSVLLPCPRSPLASPALASCVARMPSLAFHRLPSHPPSPCLPPARAFRGARQVHGARGHQQQVHHAAGGLVVVWRLYRSDRHGVANLQGRLGLPHLQARPGAQVPPARGHAASRRLSSCSAARSSSSCRPTSSTGSHARCRCVGGEIG